MEEIKKPETNKKYYFIAMDDRINFVKHFVENADALEQAVKSAEKADLPKPEHEDVEQAKSMIKEGGTILPPIITGDQFPKKFDIKPPEFLIDGILQKGDLGLLSAPSKTGKSWIWGNIAVAISAGLPIFNRETKKGPVLLIDFELKKDRICERLIDVSLARGLDEVPKDLHLWSLARVSYNLDLIIESLKAELLDRENYSLIVIDPVYMIDAGDLNFDENSAKHITLLLQALERLVADTDTALGICHHHRKNSSGGPGGASGSDPHELASGSNVFSRFPSLLMSARRHEMKDCLTLSVTCRNCKSPDDFVIELGAPLVTARNDLDPRKLRKPGQAPLLPIEAKDVILKYIPKEPMRIAKGDLYSLCCQMEIKEPEFLSALAKLDGDLIQSHIEGNEITYSTLES